MQQAVITTTTVKKLALKAEYGPLGDCLTDAVMKTTRVRLHGC